MGSTNPNIDYKIRIEQITDLPTLPAITNRILKLQQNPDASDQALADILELDPILSSQMLKYANSAFFNCARKIESLNDAIKIIGYDNALHFAISVSAARNFKLPLKGPIGMKSFWLQALYSAHLMQALANKIPQKNRPKPGLAYLAGLLHNFGFVLLGFAFPNEFHLLNTTLESKLEKEVVEVENQLLGFNHYELSIWLMRKWGLPKEIMIAVFEHHNEDYRGMHWQYANLTLLADRAMAAIKIGDTRNCELPDRILQAFGIDAETVNNCAGSLSEKKEKLNVLVNSIVKN